MKEISQLKGYEHVKDGYYITKEGKVFSARNKLGKITENIKERKQAVKTGGYFNVGLVTKDDSVKWFRVHRIVATAFCENNDNKPVVNHIDENKQNNNYENLEWVTNSENNIHSLGRKTYCYLFDGTLEKTYSFMGDCVNDGYNRGHVGSCALGKIRQHKNRIFSYEPLTKEQVVQRLSKTYYMK